MSRDTPSLLFGALNQTLAFRVPHGRPTSGTFRVFGDTTGDEGEVEFEGPVSIDAVSTAVASASGASQSDPRRVNLASVVGVAIGRKYLLAEDARQEWGEVVEIGTGYVRLRHALLGDYTTAATFKSTYAFASVDSAWAADDANLGDVSDPNPDYRVRWDLQVGGAKFLAYSYFDLVRSPTQHRVDIADLNLRWPGLADSIPVEYRVDQGRVLIDEALRLVRMDMVRVGLDVDSARDDDQVDELVILAGLRLLAEGGMHPRTMSAGEFVQLTQGNYERFFEQHVQASLRIAVAVGSDSGRDPGRQAEPYWEK